jgi:hypothetical protein
MDSFAGSALEKSPLQRPHTATAVASQRNRIAAHESALQAVQRGTKLTAILGPPGVGKTRLLEDLASRLEASGTDVWLLPPDQSVHAAEDDGVVLIDEGCRLNGEVWARMFRSPGRYVIAGQPMLAEYLKTFPYGVETIFINPTDADEVTPFFMARLPHFAEPSENVTSAAVDHLKTHAAGIPETFGTLARSAELAEHADSVRPRHIEAAPTTNVVLPVADQQPRVGPRERATPAPFGLGKHRKTWLAIVLVCLAAIGGTTMHPLQFDSQGKNASAIATPTPEAPAASPQTPGDDGMQASQPLPPPAISSAKATSPRDQPPVPQSAEGQKSAAQLVSTPAGTTLQGDDPGQHPAAKHHAPGAHAVKHHHKPASAIRPSDQSAGG